MVYYCSAVYTSATTRIVQAHNSPSAKPTTIAIACPPSSTLAVFADASAHPTDAAKQMPVSKSHSDINDQYATISRSERRSRGDTSLNKTIMSQPWPAPQAHAESRIRRRGCPPESGSCSPARGWDLRMKRSIRKRRNRTGKSSSCAKTARIYSSLQHDHREEGAPSWKPAKIGACRMGWSDLNIGTTGCSSSHRRPGPGNAEPARNSTRYRLSIHGGRSSLRPPRLWPGSCFRFGCHPLARFRNRSQHCDFQPCQCGPPRGIARPQRGGDHKSPAGWNRAATPDV